MSDLISRSELIEEINELLKSPYANKQQFGAERRDAIEIVRDLCVKRQPTAYSVDKVVEELEERTDFLKDCTKYGNKNAEQQTKSYSTMMMYEVADLVDDLIEIVKQGGVAEAEQKLKEMESD